MLKCSLDKLQALFAKIAENAKLYLPIDNSDGTASYGEWSEGTAWSNALNTTKSPKDFFFPQTEDLMKFKTEGKNIEVIDVRRECEDFVIFGVRACDVKSFDILDRVFLTEPRDSYYAMKRAHGIIVSVACQKPAETCFCGTFGIDATEPAGDVTAWKSEDALYLRANTEKGSALLDKLADLLEEGSDEAVTAQKEKTKKILDKLPLKELTTDAFGGGKTKELFDDPAWDALSATCLGCGTCTFVCPTCQCYDIKDFNTGNGVVRYRCWDSCMYSEFTRMAHGNNRLTQKERFRQRFMHKLVYFPENNDGMFSCVGCGRCLAKCPISMNIVKVMKKIGGNKGE
ncbi:MAG: 4Fe-4S dicluster domain-containing protein [Clostridia bacterium]|nr:4Fe-4S dicluster domain-containing protein [Clostridia bacterium]MBR2325648.1 4Fe-4S dicluster domain-containing protein [Clostridia bacterium]